MLPLLDFGGQTWVTVSFLAAVGFIAGLARGFSGFGSALIFVPLASAVVGPALAAPILMMIDTAGSFPMVPNAWRHAARPAVFVMSAGALLAVPIGVSVLAHVDPVIVRWGISLAILALVSPLAAGWRYHGRPHAAATVLVGIISGFLSGVAQIGGPPAIAYWIGSATSAQGVRANMVLFLALSQVYAIIAYSYSGLFTVTVVSLSLTAGPGFLIGVWIGSRMFGFASPLTFRRICYALIVLAAVVGLPIFR